MELFKIFLYTLIFTCLVLIFYIQIYNKIKTQIIKINSSENEIDDNLRLKYDLIVKIIAEIKKIIKDTKDFDDIEEIKDINISSFEFYRKLADYESKIYTIKNDNSKILKNNTFNDLWYEIININTKLKAIEKYYNDSITSYNILVSKFPSKIVALILKYKEKKYFDGKNMYDKNIKDFKI